MTQKPLIKMQISPIKNPNFERKKIWFRVCSVTAEMFEHRNSGENRRKRSEIFFENLRRPYQDLIWVKKNSKLSHACVPLKCHESDHMVQKASVTMPLASGD